MKELNNRPGLTLAVAFDTEPLTDMLNSILTDLQVLHPFMDCETVLPVLINIASKLIAEPIDDLEDLPLMNFIEQNIPYSSTEDDVTIVKELLIEGIRITQDFLNGYFTVLSLPTEIYYAYPVRGGVYLLIRESDHDESIKYLLSTTFRPHQSSAKSKH